MKCLYIYNPKSGQGKAQKKKDYIIKELSSTFANLEVIPTQYPCHAKELAESACGKYDYLFVAGGDGTLNEVVGGIAEKHNKPIIGYIPLGTVNDFAHSVGIPINTKKAVKNICNGVPMQHEIFKAGASYGVYICAMGVGTETSYATKQKDKMILGKSAYFLHGLKKIFTTKSIPLTLEFDGGKIQGNFALFLAVNSKCVASFRLNNDFTYNDGYVDILLIEENKKLVSLPRLIDISNIFLFGLNKKLPKQATRLRLKNFTLTAPDSAVINLDGEGVGSGKFDFKVIKDGFQIIIPKN